MQAEPAYHSHSDLCPHFGEFDAHVPEFFLERFVATQWRGFSRLALDEILSRDASHFRRCGEVHGSARALFWRQHEPATQHRQNRNLAPDLGRNDTGMERIDGYSLPIQAPGKCIGEHHVLKLARGVHRDIPVRAFSLQIPEIQSPTFVSTRCDVDYARRRCCKERWKQQIGQHEVCEIVHSKRTLDTIDGNFALLERDTCVVDQHIHARMCVDYCLHHGSNFCLNGKICNAKFGSAPSAACLGRAFDLCPRGFAALSIATDHYNVRAECS